MNTQDDMYMKIPKVVTTEGMELERLKYVVGQFINSCSHSMRGPLKSIEGLVSLLQNKRQYTEEETAMLFKSITDSTRKMESMLDDLEQFLENSRREVFSHEVDLAEVIHEVLKGYDKQLSAKGIVTAVKIEQLVKFNTDANRLRIVLSNIIENAILFSDPDKALRWLDIQGHVSFSNCSINILDNGIGMKSGSESKVFDLFFRGSERSQGLGVGLYVVREILEKMGGSITVYSKLNIGSKFFIWLPNHIRAN
ncbi:sensor histidine kinase [Dawidia soli]|uniref:histidine kinase n=1 Tax=Dawidia soli TaxID=2782352 RepID=A0AAP2DEQ9_9BACT|nr:HAMP domain-containing sensor histidine kinase [Dawidia soli]MBT1690354.1 HAMP domain-containing histidine kinase [Dawidia soli]